MRKMLSEIMQGRRVTKRYAVVLASEVLSVMQAKISLAAACLITLRSYKGREEDWNGVPGELSIWKLMEHLEEADGKKALF